MRDKKSMLLEQTILQYIANREPIGSETLRLSMHGFCSSATIRNYFKTLVQEGWLSQPYSSAGRIPTFSALKNHWLKTINAKDVLNVDLDRIEKSAHSNEICVSVKIEGVNKLLKIVSIEDFLILVFEHSKFLISYNSAVKRFLSEFIGLELKDIQKLITQLKARQLDDILAVSEGELQHIGIGVLSELLKEDERVFLDIIQGRFFNELDSGIYFEEVLPSGYIGIMQDVKSKCGKAGRMFVSGSLERDYSDFYARITS